MNWTEEMRERTKSLYAHELCHREIAQVLQEEFGVDTTARAISSLISRLGVQRPRNGTIWPHNIRVRIKELFESHATCAEVASVVSREFDIVLTKNAVAGLVWRMGAQRVAKPSEKNVARVQRMTEERECMSELLHDFSNVPVPRGQKSAGCRYIFGDVLEGRWRYCQHRQEPRSSYCSHHLALCTLPST